MSSQPPPPLPFHLREGNATDRIDAHLAEYSMLTTRATYSVAFCTAVWSLIAGYLALMVNMAARLKQSSLLQWASVLAIELMLAWISTFILDQYVIVLYLETELAPILSQHLGPRREFWKWERFIAKRRSKYLPLFWEWAMTIGATVALTTNLVWRLRWGWTDWDFLILPAAFLIYFNLRLARSMTKTRQEWTDFNLNWESRFREG